MATPFIVLSEYILNIFDNYIQFPVLVPDIQRARELAITKYAARAITASQLADALNTTNAAIINSYQTAADNPHPQHPPPPITHIHTVYLREPAQTFFHQLAAANPIEPIAALILLLLNATITPTAFLQQLQSIPNIVLPADTLTAHHLQRYINNVPRVAYFRSLFYATRIPLPRAQRQEHTHI